MMVLTESDSDAILVEPMKNRTSGEMIRAYQVIINQPRSTRIAPKQHILDNECSYNFKEAIKTNNMTYQLVPPHAHDHRQNKAKNAIQTFKDHFVAILCGANTLLPLNLWDLLFMPSRTHPQHVATITHDSHGISLHVPLGATRLQCKLLCTPGM